MSHRTRATLAHKQSGLVLVVITAAMVVFIAVAAFAIDITHVMVNKTRLQNALDSVALAAASIANSTRSESDTQATVIQVYQKVVAASGNSELALSSAEDGATLNLLATEYSSTPNSGFSAAFPSSSAEHIYVRVSVSGLGMPEFLIQAFNLEKSVSASAVAGPTYVNDTTNILPIGMCEGDEAGPSGYSVGTVYEIKSGSQSSGDGLGAGNYHLLDMGSGSSDVSDALVGKNTTVVTIGEDLYTEPGNAVGPTGSIDSRFEGETLGGIYYPPDLIITEPSTTITLDNLASYNDSVDPDKWSFDKYQTETSECLLNADCDKSGSVAWRRILPVPILDCASSTQSGGKIEFQVNNIGCFFLIQRYSSNSGGAGKQSIFGEFIEHCSVVDGGISDTTTGVTRMVLFKDPMLGGGV
ncbi:TadE/TadG family type IV pilus assembly protein [Vibrio aestuarianus]|uniref:TadE/TadG family type IV pilus assembly protein n=1 Tax=Vibrio aestuarianus TaxID=28171 RepID=UPI00406978D9